MLSAMKAPGRAVVVSLAVVLLTLAGHAVGQTRPLLTEEAKTAPGGTIAFEVGGDFMHREPNFLTRQVRDVAQGPTLRFIFSPGDAVEIDVEWVARVAAFNDAQYGNVSDWGDITLRTKARVWAGAGNRPTVALRYGLTLPQTKCCAAGYALGPNALRMTADVLASQAVAGFVLHGNAGLGVHDEVLRPHEQRDFLTYGMAVERPFGRRVVLLGEWAGRAGRGMPGADSHSELRLGLRLGSERLRWDAALRRGLDPADGKWGATAGLRWVLRRGRG
jgi:hypothetical protein